jgi:hypothetical protein
MTRQHMIVAALVAAAVIAAIVEFYPRGAAPVPAPAALSLRGQFHGPTAAEDAAAFAGLCHGIAAALTVDGTVPTPRITTGVHVEDLRIASSEGRFLPRSLSRDQPHAVAVAGRYLDSVVGTSGGPLAADSRQQWVEAFRELARAAEEAVR